MGDSLKELFERMRESLNEPPSRLIEVYPRAWKEHPELNELCEARIKSGLGVWSEPIPEDYDGTFAIKPDALDGK